MLSFDRYSRDDVIGEVLLPVYEALEEMTATESTLRDKSDNGNHSATVLARDIAPRSHKVTTRLAPLRVLGASIYINVKIPVARR